MVAVWFVVRRRGTDIVDTLDLRANKGAVKMVAVWLVVWGRKVNILGALDFGLSRTDKCAMEVIAVRFIVRKMRLAGFVQAGWNCSG